MHITNFARFNLLGAMLFATPMLSAQTEHADSHLTEHEAVPQTSVKSVDKHAQHEQMMQAEHQQHQQHQQHQLMNMLHPVEKAATATTHDHRQEHGGQWYQSSMLESKWMQHAGGRGVWQSELESRVGTDEHKLFFKLHTQQAESQQTEYEAQVLYSRMISDFWDIQAGVAYQQEDQTSAQQWRGVVGLHGLAPYFFETEAYLSLAEDQQVQLSLDTERDFLLTQKLILAPYLQAKLVLSDESEQAQKTGLNQLQTGLQMRYEISKKVMPFVDVAYGYHKGLAQTAEQDATESEQGWQYGAGLRLKF